MTAPLMPSDDIDLHETRDPRVWAEEFNRVLISHNEQPIDPDLLMGWFANAMMKGSDDKAREMRPFRELCRELAEALVELDHHFNGTMGLVYALKVHETYWEKLILEPKKMIEQALAKARAAGVIE